ncbi:MAG: hypothetical protein ACD_58C00330G0005 [uncultured bacterium]|nr:MAG: hypothetical protein ACD_58C00330G0005 [uncultured bacterium]
MLDTFKKKNNGRVTFKYDKGKKKMIFTVNDNYNTSNGVSRIKVEIETNCHYDKELAEFKDSFHKDLLDEIKKDREEALNDTEYWEKLGEFISWKVKDFISLVGFAGKDTKNEISLVMINIYNEFADQCRKITEDKPENIQADEVFDLMTSLVNTFKKDYFDLRSNFAKKQCISGIVSIVQEQMGVLMATLIKKSI